MYTMMQNKYQRSDFMVCMCNVWLQNRGFLNHIISTYWVAHYYAYAIDAFIYINPTLANILFQICRFEIRMPIHQGQEYIVTNPDV